MACAFCCKPGLPAMYVTAFSSNQLGYSTKPLLNNACSVTGRHIKSKMHFEAQSCILKQLTGDDD